MTLEAIRLASDETLPSRDRLRADLTDRAYLQRLNTEIEYLAREPGELQLYSILEALARNDSPAAQALLGELSQTQLYAHPGPYLAALLEASAHAVDPGPELVAFWEKQLEPEASELHRAVDVLVANGSKEAMRLFERALTSSRQREDHVVAWLRDPVLRHRQDLPLLETCERLLRTKDWPERRKRFLVEVLFDYQPKAWYQVDVDPPRPPPRSELDDVARESLQRIAELARDQGILERDRLREIEDELAR